MTNQEALTTSIRALRKQRVQSLNARNQNCMYRGDKGRKCAIGHLIPDDLYDPSMENTNTMMLLDRFPTIKKFFRNCSEDLLHALQTVHDLSSPKEWEQEWEKTAQRFHLRYRAPRNLTTKKGSR